MWEYSGCKSAAPLLAYRFRDQRAQTVHQTAALPDGFRGSETSQPSWRRAAAQFSLNSPTCPQVPSPGFCPPTMRRCFCVSSAVSFPDADLCPLSSSLPDVARAIELLEKLQESGDVPGHKLQSLKKVLQSEFCTAIREVGDGREASRSEPVVIVTVFGFLSSRMTFTSTLQPSLCFPLTVTSRSAEFSQKNDKKTS